MKQIEGRYYKFQLLSHFFFKPITGARCIITLTTFSHKELQSLLYRNHREQIDDPKHAHRHFRSFQGIGKLVDWITKKNLSSGNPCSLEVPLMEWAQKELYRTQMTVSYMEVFISENLDRIFGLWSYVLIYNMLSSL